MLAPPYGVMQRYVVFENAFDLLPQRRTNIGIIADLDAATLDEARAFHQAYYGPDSAALIVAGNFDVANLRALVVKYFAVIPVRARPQPIAVATREARRTKPRSVAATAPTVPLPAIGAIYQLPEATHADLPALTVLDAVLSAGENSRLQRALVRTGKAVQAAEMLFSSQEGGFLATFALASPAADHAEIAGLLSAELERARTEPVTEEELREARNQLFSAALTRRQTPAGRASELGEALMTRGDVRAADRQLRAIGQVTAADVQRVAREWLRPDGVVTFTYTQGSGGAASYANPVPLPRFGSLPPAVGEPAVLRDEASRQQPPPPAAAPRIAKPEIVEATLANGIRVVSAQTGTVPLATMSVVLPGGTATDPAHQAGLSELAAAIANKGTPTRTAEQIAATLESLGASMGASPGADGVVFSVTAPAANLAAAGEVMEDVIRNASYPDAEVERERARIVNGLRVGLRDPATLAALTAPRVFYGSAPYGSIATLESLPRITRSDLVAWREANWHPATARVVVSGGIAPAETQRIADRLFGDWRSAAPAPRAVANPAGTAPPPRTIVIDLPEAAQAMVYAGVRTTNRAGPDYYPLDIANSVLGLSSTSRLNTEVRMKRGLSYSARSSMPQRAGEAVLSATVQTQNATVDEVVQIVLDQFAALGFAARRRGRAATAARVPCRCGRPGARDQRRVQRGGDQPVAARAGSRRGDAARGTLGRGDARGGCCGGAALRHARTHLADRGRQCGRVRRGLAQDQAGPGGDPGRRTRPVERGAGQVAPHALSKKSATRRDQRRTKKVDMKIVHSTCGFAVAILLAATAASAQDRPRLLRPRPSTWPRSSRATQILTRLTRSARLR